MANKCTLKRTLKCISRQQQIAKTERQAFGTTVTSPPHDVKCHTCCKYIVVFLCAYTVQRFTFCTFEQTKINIFIQVQTHKAKSTFAFLGNAGLLAPSRRVLREHQLIFAYRFKSPNTDSGSWSELKRLESGIQQACCWS